MTERDKILKHLKIQAEVKRLIEAGLGLGIGYIASDYAYIDADDLDKTATSIADYMIESIENAGETS